ncbi:excinuclease ABC subunit UvrC [Alkalimarinus sediminis]|uniref:UvrABC system protein C n=2 Tax=Alkalimarinus sediminis TaxID=1632866 RepID=A0A9E8KQ72_9ALTE|nr:excinuclease ABC subunit UvrC [Alkalimarinus sediminis]
MYDAGGDILYVGKARNLKNRVSSYFRTTGLHIKTRALVAKIANIEITVTESETEALLLEQNLIKDLKPPYNILLRDDKSYPYIYLSSHKDYPSLTFKRARSKTQKGKYFGPYPSSGAVRESLNLLQKIFKIRQCDESFYRNRTRPCLQHQIKRCSAPCVNLISAEDYQKDMQRATMFLEGKNPQVISQLVEAMGEASKSLEFEKAAEIRDQIDFLRHVQEQQSIESGAGNIDVVGLAIKAGAACLSFMFIRGGRVLGHKNYFPKLALEQDDAALLGDFLAQFYLSDARSNDYPREIVVPCMPEDADLLQSALSDSLGVNIKITSNVRTDKNKWRQLAQSNAEMSIASYLSKKENVFQRVEALRVALDMNEVPKRIECFDISHSSGEKTVASCVVFNDQGPFKADYRIYNIDGITAGDDYAAMRQVLTRRYKKLKSGEGKWPDIVLIDGGKGQLGVAVEVFESLQLTGIQLVGVAKGATRKAGFETLILPKGEGDRTLNLSADSPALHLIQHVRDEAHRFAITGHRQRRDKVRKTSTLENIDGIGPKRRRELLKYFGGLQEVKKASAEEIAKVPGISKTIAVIIYDHLHSD